MDDGTQRSQQDTARSARSVYALPALLIAINLILVSVIIVRPWQVQPQGLAPQVQPDHPDLRDLDTGTAAGELAPNFLLQNQHGEWVELASLRGTPVMLNFWATSCIYCISEMPAIQRVADQFDGGVVVIGVNVGESPETVGDFAAANDIRFGLVLDRSMDVTQAYGVPALPTSLFIDAFGVVQAKHTGPLLPENMTDQFELLMVGVPASEVAASQR